MTSLPNDDILRGYTGVIGLIEGLWGSCSDYRGYIGIKGRILQLHKDYSGYIGGIYG